ncbi:hypothetical protein [Aquirufa aurantiipilula]
MKYSKFPKVLCYDDWFDLFDGINNKEFKGIPFRTDIFYYPETEEMKEKRVSILDSLKKYKKEIIEIEEKMVQYLQLDIIREPSIYIAVLKDTRNPEHENITAKTFWPLVGGGKKEIRIYIGRVSDYPHIKRSNLSSSDEIKNKAVLMMKKHLTENYELGRLPLHPRPLPSGVLKRNEKE